jgi:integrase
MTPGELLALKALVASEEARHNHAQLPDNFTADIDGVLQTKEDAMYSWISPNPYAHYNRFKVWFRDIQGRKRSQTFPTRAEAVSWITDNQRLLVTDGRAIEKVVDAYLAGLVDRKPSTLTTLRFRLGAVIKGRERIAIEAFPWMAAWNAYIAPQSRASQTGVLAALRGLVGFAGLPAKALDGLKPKGEVRSGKDQLTIDEARRFVGFGLMAGDPLALAAVTMAFTGCRPGEVLALKARDVDDQGAILHVRGTKTRAARRTIPVDPAFQGILLAAAHRLAPDAVLFEAAPERHRASKDASKAGLDALRRRVAGLCRQAGVQRVVSHSLRGLNSTLRLTGGAPDESITRALGHIDISTTRRSYFAPGLADQVDARRAHGRLLPARELDGVVSVPGRSAA